MRLVDLGIGERGIIVKVKGRGAFRNRITEMGFVVGKMVTVIKKAPLKDPIEYRILDYNLSLRRSEAELIEVLSEQEAKTQLYEKPFEGIISDNELKHTVAKKEKTIHIALVGNPNSGKTTIFNFASGQKERVGNYSGVTVDAKEGYIDYNGYKIKIIDLPGTYSTTAYSPEELYVRNYILHETPDVIVNVVDASNLERNMYLTTQLIDMDVKVVVALNMYDELLRKGTRFYYNDLGKMLGIPFVPTIGSKGKGIKKLLDRIINVYEDKDQTIRHIHINYGQCIERSIKKIQTEVKQNLSLTDRISSRYVSVKLLEKDQEIKKLIAKYPNSEEIIAKTEQEINYLEKAIKDDTETQITDARFGFISGALKETIRYNSEQKKQRTEIIDTFLTHRFFGIPVFIMFMFLMFFTTFKIGEYPMHWLEYLVQAIGSTAEQYLPQSIFKSLLIDGVISGVGGVLVFLPNILLLFFFISLMEDTGYMARAVFIMDKAMHKIGLHGKSFIPLVMGFGCNVPAIMSSRIIESRRDRLLTILINPFMSCSARLPVYILFIGAFFHSYQSLILFGIYAIGILLAIISAFLFKKTFLAKPDIPFVMELPPYRIPTWQTTLRHMWFRASQYLKKMGGIILIASIIVWFLGYITIDNKNKIAQQQKKVKSIESKMAIQSSKLSDSLKQVLLKEKLHLTEVKQEYSLIGHLGKTIEPIMRPLGFDWKMSVSVLTGIAAKEIIVGTLGVLYANDGVNNKLTLSEKLKNYTYKTGENTGKRAFNPLVALCFMLFVLIYFPCVAVVSAIKKEAGSWKWAVFSVVYTTSLAWIITFAVYQIGLIF